METLSKINLLLVHFLLTIYTLPITYTSVKAWQQANNIAVEWKVTDELGIKNYEVEKSIDGKNFEVVTTVSAKGDGSGSEDLSYDWIDTSAVTGDNYYRIVAINYNGQQLYTQIIKVSIDNSVTGISIWPNPVTNGIFNLQMNNLHKGEYTVSLVNNIGQHLLSKKIPYYGGNTSELINITQYIAKGIYELEISYPEGKKTTTKLLVK